MIREIIESEIKKIITGDNDPIVQEPNNTINPSKKIVVLQRGWVIVGDFNQDGDYCQLKNASVIRRWGTDKGLGQLAKEGKLPDTVLDPSPDINFHILTSLFIIDCDKDAWND